MVKESMRPRELFVRCYAEEQQDGSWFAVCIDLNLVAEGSSAEDVRRRLHLIIQDYLHAVLTQHQGHVWDLLRRRAPLSFVVKYHFIRAWCRGVRAWCWIAERIEHHRRNNKAPGHLQIFEEFVPVKPAWCA